MGLMLDTSILIALERGKISTKQLAHYGQAYINPIVLTELLMGIDRADNDNRRIKRFAFIEYTKSLFTILPFGTGEAYTYARIIHDLYKANITIGTHDLLIATTAITHGYPLLTLNIKDFKRIQGLEVLTASLKD